jgi:hypothetical protein
MSGGHLAAPVRHSRESENPEVRAETQRRRDAGARTSEAPPRLRASARTITGRLKIRCPTACSLCSISRDAPSAEGSCEVKQMGDFGILIVTPKAPLSVTLVTISGPAEAQALPMDSPFCVRKPAFCDWSHVGAQINEDRRQIDPRDSCATLRPRGDQP